LFIASGAFARKHPRAAAGVHLEQIEPSGDFFAHDVAGLQRDLGHRAIGIRGELQQVRFAGGEGDAIGRRRQVFVLLKDILCRIQVQRFGRLAAIGEDRLAEKREHPAGHRVPSR